MCYFTIRPPGSPRAAGNCSLSDSHSQFHKSSLVWFIRFKLIWFFCGEVAWIKSNTKILQMFQFFRTVQWPSGSVLKAGICSWKRFSSPSKCYKVLWCSVLSSNFLHVFLLYFCFLSKPNSLICCLSFQAEKLSEPIVWKYHFLYFYQLSNMFFDTTAWVVAGSRQHLIHHKLQ